MPDIRTLRTIEQGNIRIASVTQGIARPVKVQQASIVYPYEQYTGAYEITPTGEAQTISVKDKLMTGNIVINPIPNNYGLITWDGSTLTVS